MNPAASLATALSVQVAQVEQAEVWASPISRWTTDFCLE